MSEVIEIDGEDLGGDFIDIPDEELHKRPMPEPQVREEVVAEDSSNDLPAEEEDDEDARGSAGLTVIGDEGEADADEKDEAEEEPKAEVEQKKDSKPINADVALAPLRAAGRDFQINSVDELRKLAQMGVDYTKKMQALAPNLKLMKMLENNGLLSEDKLSYLIDLDKKNPQAVAKLLKESGQDPLDVDLDQAESYKPNRYTVDDKQMALDNVLRDLEGSEGFQTTIDTVGNKWDADSKKVVLDNPDILRDINQHVETGIFQVIQDEIVRQKTLGHLTGMSSLQAYKAVGDSLHKQGVFQQVLQQRQATSQPRQQAPMQQPQVQQKPVKEKKRAASLTKGAAPKKVTKANFNPLAMSDEEIMKIAQTLQY